MKTFRHVVSCITFLIIMVFISGCYTANKSHNTAHNRALKKDVELLHKDLDSFLGTAKPSMLSER
ncbi:MAG: hypothetical protein ACE5KZ_00275 [Candidatus Scalinduaceae bacterium]